MNFNHHNFLILHRSNNIYFMNGDPGHFGPNSMMWKVNKEITVLFGGARALLMHAAHPLIAAGARQTSFYQRDPWKRLIRTLSLQNSVTFGTIESK